MYMAYRFSLFPYIYIYIYIGITSKINIFWKFSTSNWSNASINDKRHLLMKLALHSTIDLNVWHKRLTQLEDARKNNKFEVFLTQLHWHSISAKKYYHSYFDTPFWHTDQEPSYFRRDPLPFLSIVLTPRTSRPTGHVTGPGLILIVGLVLVERSHVSQKGGHVL